MTENSNLPAPAVKPPLTKSQKFAALVIGVLLFSAAAGLVATVVGALFAASRFLWEYALR